MYPKVPKEEGNKQQIKAKLRTTTFGSQFTFCFFLSQLNFIIVQRISLIGGCD